MISCVSCTALRKVAQPARKAPSVLTTSQAGAMKRHVFTKAASTTVDDKMGQIVEPSVFNKQGVRFGSILASITAAALAGKISHGVIYLIQVLPVWPTFIFTHAHFAGIVMIKNMPRQTFGKVQSKLFPILFGLTTACSTVVLATLYMGPLAAIATPRVQYTAILGVVTSLANLLFIEPAATKIMFERYDLENKTDSKPDAEARKALTKKFGMLHGMSSLTALGNLCAVMSHFVWLGLLVQGSLV